MADSSARKIAFEPNRKSEIGEEKRAKIVLNPHKVPLSKFEKTLLFAGSIMTLAMMTFLVSASVSATSAQHELVDVQQSVAKGQNQTTELRQEIGALTSNQQLKKAIHRQGLELIDKNIRTIR